MIKQRKREKTKGLKRIVTQENMKNQLMKNQGETNMGGAGFPVLFWRRRENLQALTYNEPILSDRDLTVIDLMWNKQEIKKCYGGGVVIQLIEEVQVGDDEALATQEVYSKWGLQK